MTSVNIPISSDSVDTKSSKNINYKPIVFGVVVGTLFTASLAYAFYLGTKSNPVPAELTNNNLSPTQQIQPTSIPTAAITSAPSSSAPDLSHLTWQPAKLVTNPSIFVKSDPDRGQGSGYLYNEAKTYQVAQAPDGSKLYNVFLPFEGPGNPVIIRLVQKNNNYYYLKPLVDTSVLAEIQLGRIFTSSVKPLEASLVELTVPSEIALNNNQKVRTYANWGMGKQQESELKDAKTIDNVFLGKVVVEYSNIQIGNSKYPDVFTRSMYLVLKDSTLINIKPAYGFFYDDKNLSVNFTDDSFKSQTFKDIVFAKCGGSIDNTIVKAGDAIPGNNQVGTVWNNDKSSPIFYNNNPDTNVLKVIYDQYKLGRDYPSAPPYMSFDEFIKQKTNLLWRDPFGDWVLYTNQEYAPAVECGKPVVYLYPTTDTQVNVKVGAAITKSEPAYPASGWTVLAQKSGNLIYQDQNYPYLFWEGQGNGLYPNLSQYGTVVSQDKLISTLKSQLFKLGLNQKESSDFLEFWQPKLPSTPFVRLTWLGTRDMDQLAPLSVSPAPDTRIRIFLEFEGLDSYKALIPQKLSSPHRSGFTLIEWGGLLFKHQ